MGESKKNRKEKLLFVIMPIFNWFKRIVKSLIENKLILLLAGVYIIFHELFEELFTAKVVKYILFKCVSSSWNDVVFGVILLWAVILIVYRLYKRFHISDKRILISLILLFAWCYYRFIEHVWAFEPFTFWHGLKYVDAIAAFLMGNLLVWICFNLCELIVCGWKAFVHWIEKISQYISNKRILISLIFIFVWWCCLFSEYVWTFESFTLWHGLKYVDAIAGFLVGNILVWICFYKKNVSHLLINIALYLEQKFPLLLRLQRFRDFKKNKLDNEPKGFCFDSPLSKSDPDLLNREKVVQQVCERIQNTANRDASFAIGITSEWGNGKTSFLNLIERHLDKNKRVIIHYNPWLNSDRKSATLSFFDEMSSALKAYDSSLSNDILKYAKMLIDSSAGKYADLINACLSLDGTPTLRERFEEINKAIKRTRLQIIVFIDDIDRLYDSEILEVLSLIRNSANFSNTIFIVAYDRNYLVSALKKVNEYHPYAYLEKIFQLELPLPQFERDIIAKILKDKLLPYLLDEDKIELNKVIITSINKYDSEYYIYNEESRTIPNFILDGIKTIRDVNRLVNSFLVSYDSLKKEIVLADLLRLELLKIRYLGVYELLANNMKQFLTSEKHRSTGETIINFIKGKAGKTVFYKYLNEHVNEVGVSKHQIEDVMKYVDYVFSKKWPVIPKSIVSPTGIRRYFHYALLNGNLSQIEFDNLRDDESDSNYWSYIKNNISNTFELKGILDVVFYKDDNDYKRILCSLLYVVSYANEKNRSGFLNLIVRMVMDKRFKIFLDHLDEETEDNIYSNIDEDFLNVLMGCLFIKSELLKSESGIPLFTLCARKWFNLFAKNIIQTLKVNKDVSITDSDIYWYKITPAILETFQDWAKFESFISGLDETKSEGLKEFKVFYQKLKEADFREIKYDFKVIKF